MSMNQPKPIIAICDDNDYLRTQLEQVLRRTGKYEVMIAQTWCAPNHYFVVSIAQLQFGFCGPAKRL